MAEAVYLVNDVVYVIEDSRGYVIGANMHDYTVRVYVRKDHFMVYVRKLVKHDVSEDMRLSINVSYEQQFFNREASRRFEVVVPQVKRLIRRARRG